MTRNRGAVVHAANDLRVDDLPEPEAAAGQVVLDIAFGGVCGSDLHYVRRAAVAEPLAVGLHALNRAGDVAGRRLLVTGAGPIGCLLVAAARHRGAAEIIVTDLTDEALAVATAVGATTVLRADAPAQDGADGIDAVDVAVEASGSGAGLAFCIEKIRRGGTVVQLGLLPRGRRRCSATSW